MKKLLSILTFSFVLLFIANTTVYGQFDKFIKKKSKDAKNAAVNSVLGVEEDENNNQQQQNQNSNNGNFEKGQKLTPPDINELITSAQSAYAQEQYSNARFDIKEALKGVELEIGYEILAQMPESAHQLSSNPENDGVVSTGVGFVGLMVSRYYEGSNKQIAATVGNNAMMSGMYGMMMNSGYTTRGTQAKNITIQGYRGNLSFDEQSTYTLVVPFAQSSVLVLACSGFANEDEVRQAAEEFNIKAYEELLIDDESDRRTDLTGDVYLKTASSKYSEKDIEGCRFELQNALIDVDVKIGKMVLDMLPDELAGLKVVEGQDEHVATTAGFAGVYVTRTYASPDNSKVIELSLMDDSPMMAMVSSFLSNPLLSGMSGQKSIKIDGYKGMYQVEEGSTPSATDINIPNNQSLFSMHFVNFSEREVNDAANQVPVGKIFDVTR
ncbi:hypothetical protein [Sediminitomix flava]|uniref:Uncharacterized protein n=1 Tax=Sediminitomix flava TaxID=379075 RepID=A0A316A2W3_SEDFL|nr:hypothetical protein [Sediminitomix flava]PWJ44047.1 hypothetical protein BC781_101397 [Sediminitomix flava]